MVELIQFHKTDTKTAERTLFNQSSRKDAFRNLSVPAPFCVPAPFQPLHQQSQERLNHSSAVRKSIEFQAHDPGLSEPEIRQRRAVGAVEVPTCLCKFSST